MTNTQIRDTLLKASRSLKRSGLERGFVGRKGGPMCAMGAINKALHGYPDYRPDVAPCHEVAAVVRKALVLPDVDGRSDNPTFAVARWSNNSLSCDQVVAGLRYAAESVDVNSGPIL